MVIIMQNDRCYHNTCMHSNDAVIALCMTAATSRNKSIGFTGKCPNFIARNRYETVSHTFCGMRHRAKTNSSQV